MSWKKAITSFWDNHLPVYISANGEYEYYALRMTDGCIVHGIEPEFEETIVVANSFFEFIEKICVGEINV